MDVAYVTVHEGYRGEIGSARFYVVSDATRWDRLGLARMAHRLWRIMKEESPDVVFSTGAAPGCIALFLGWLLGARTIWLDSFANVASMSLSGRLVGRIADLRLTQWPGLARERGPYYVGSVL
jgi:UDP-N-acetylglucosamine:LPS N-acetylglucosamine transferase